MKKPIGRLKTAINYALSQKQRVYQIFDHGEMPLDNNHDEQQIRPTTIGRKNYLFTKSEVGTRNSGKILHHQLKKSSPKYPFLGYLSELLIKTVCYAVFTFERTIKYNETGV